MQYLNLGVRDKYTVMKTHFIFNSSVLAYPRILQLINVLIKNNFPVAVISNRLETRKLKQTLLLPKLTLIGADQGHNLRDLYLQACPADAELRYLTVVFDCESEFSVVAEELGFYVINIKNKKLQEIFKKLKVTEPHQLQYLPEIKKIKDFLNNKIGYPLSIYQYLHGEFTDTGITLNKKSKKIAGEPLLDLGNFNYLINNPGDPFFLSKNFSGHTCIFEQDVINILGRYYGLPDLAARGFVTSGGTEGNFSGLWWARNNLMAKLAKQFARKIPRIAIYFLVRHTIQFPKLPDN